MTRKSNFLLLLPVLLLAGCAGRSGITLPEMAGWESRKAVLERTDEWEFAGRIGLSAGDEGFNGKLWWRQDGLVFRARVSGPLGVGTIFINGNGGELTLTDRDGVVTELVDAETELRQRYGWTIPVTSLRYWALGIPDPGPVSQLEFGADGLMNTLGQRNWNVTIGQYAEAAGQMMPRRLTALHDDIRLRLVIDTWTFR